MSSAAASIAILTEVRDRAAMAAPDAAMAMGETYQDYVKNVTLTRFRHPPGTRTPSPPGQPPAEVTGELRRSITCRRGPGGGMYGSSVVSPHTVYACIQEYGGFIYPTRHKFLKWVNEGDPTWKKQVYLPPRPYMAPATRDTIANGSLTLAAMKSFETNVWG